MKEQEEIRNEKTKNYCKSHVTFPGVFAGSRFNCMLFEDFDGNQVVAYHAPNENSHPVFQYISEDESGNIIFTDR